MEKYEGKRSELALFGQNLQLFKEGLSGNQLARELGYDKGSISKLLNGEQNFTLKTLGKFAEKLNVPVNFLFRRDLFVTGTEGIQVNEEYEEEGYSFSENWFEDFLSNLNKALNSPGTPKVIDLDHPPSYIYRLRKGEYPGVRIKTILDLSDQIGVPIIELLQERK